MYRVTISRARLYDKKIKSLITSDSKNLYSSDESILSDDSENTSDLKIVGGTITQAINSIDSFSFTIYPSNPHYNNLVKMKTKIAVYDDIHDGEKVFNGRILTITNSMDEQGKICKSIVCEGMLGYLCDSVQPFAELHNISVRNFLSNMIYNHNQESSQKFRVGAVGVTDSNDSLYRYLNWENTLDDIKEKLIDKLGGEIQIHEDENGDIILDYLERIGGGSDTKIELAVNLKSLTQTTDATTMITRLYPLGAKKDDSEERLTIASANNGSPYIQDDGLVLKYGVISGTQTWDDVTKAGNLLTKSKAYLASLNKIKKQYQITALDLSTINKNVEEFVLGNYHTIINPLMKIDEELRIIGLTINIDEPHKSALTFGDKFETLTSLTSNRNKSLQAQITDTQFRNIQVVNDKVENATQLITGALGGHVILDPSEMPSRILVMDTASIDTCKSCIQLNKNGLGFWNYAKDGGSAKTGPYKNAWTIDGNLVAEFITALTLTGLKINNGNGTFSVDEDGHLIANSLSSTNANITGGKININTNGENADLIKLNLQSDSGTLFEMSISPMQIIAKSTGGLSDTYSQFTSAYVKIGCSSGSVTLNGDNVKVIGGNISTNKNVLSNNLYFNIEDNGSSKSIRDFYNEFIEYKKQ